MAEQKEEERTPFSPCRMGEHRFNKAFTPLWVGFVRSMSALFIYSRRCTTISTKELLINDDIRAKEVRLLDENGDQMGIMSLSEAMDYAEDRGVDLVCIAPQATPPVCRAMDYGKYRYEQDKREKEQKKKQQTVEVKEVQLSCRIDKHDFDTKASRAIKFLKEGNKVRVSLRFKGREMAHQDLGREVIAKFREACEEFSTMDKKPTLEGRQMTMFLMPLKASSKKADKSEKPKTEKETPKAEAESNTAE